MADLFDVRLEPPQNVQYVVGERKSANDPLGLLVRGIEKELVPAMQAYGLGLLLAAAVLFALAACQPEPVGNNATAAALRVRG